MSQAASSAHDYLHSLSPSDDNSSRRNEFLSDGRPTLGNGTVPDPGLKERPGDQDSALHQLSVHDNEDDNNFDPDSEAVRRVRWKVDRVLIPLLSLLYLCSFLDRVNIGNAKVAHLERDLKLEPGIYNLSLSIFYVGYIVGEIPANLALKKLGPRRWIPLVMLSWAGVSMSMAAVTNGAGLLATRFFLGLAESGYAPGPVYIISLWYRRREQAIRNAIFFSAATVAGAFGGLLAYAIAHMDGYRGFHGWQWIFILEGLPTIISCFIALWLLPDFPENSTFLTPAETALVIQRLRVDAGPATESAFSWSEAISAFTDWKVYHHILLGLLHAVPFSSLGVFVPAITLGFGFDPITTQLATVPIYVAACLATLFLAWSSDHFSERGYHFAFAEAVACLGYVLLIATRNSTLGARYISLMICAMGVYAGIPVQLSWPSSNIGGATKKGVAIAAVISLSQLGSIIGGQTYRDDDAPMYIRGHTISACVLFLNIFNSFALKYLLKRENSRRDNLSTQDYENEMRHIILTDKHPDFRFWT